MLQGLIIYIKIMEAVSTVVDMKIITAKEGAVCNAEENNEAAVVVMSTGI